MTREEAIKRLEVIRAEHAKPLELNSREDVRNAIGVYLEAIDMAIEALRQMEEKSCSRCINKDCCLIKFKFEHIEYCSDWSEYL